MTALPPQRARRRFDRPRAVVRALTALVTLLGLVGGVPVLLLRFGHWPITGVPTWDQIKDLPTTVVSDEAIPTVLAVAPWLTWALFVGCVVAEGAAQLRGRSRSALRFGGPLQRAAGYLVGSLVMSIGPLATPGAMAMGVLPSAPPVAAAELPPGGPGANQALATDVVAASTAAAGPGTPSARAAGPGLDDTVPSAEARTAVPALGGGQPADDDPRGPGGAGAGAAEAQDAAPVTITVRHGDSPWSLAAGHLGDGTRWREIWELNRGRPQPGGDAWVDPEAPIEPGWRLALPADAQGARVRGGAASGATDTTTAGDAPATDLTVAPGDNFWSLAEAELTDEWGRAPTDAEVAGYWTTLIDENRDRLLPPQDPDLIYPGQAFVVPATPADPTAPPAPPEPTTPPPDSDASGGTAPPPTGDAAGEVGDEAGGTGDHAHDEMGTGQGPGGETPANGSGQVQDPDDIAAGLADEALPEDPTESGDEHAEGNPYPGEAPPASGAPGSGTPATPHGGASDPDADTVSPPTTAGRTGETPCDGNADQGDQGGIAGGTIPDGSVPDPGVADGGPPAQGGQPAGTSGGRTDEGSNLPIGLIGGGVALAGVVLLLDRRRRAQQRHRRAGRHIPLPPPTLERSEGVLRQGADVDGARHLEVALRAAAAGSGAAGLPPLRWVEVQESDVLLVLATASPPPPGFAALSHDRWVTSGGFDELEAIAAHAELPAPTLMPVGTTADDAEVLIELEASGVVTVVGPPETSTGLLRAVALAAATAPWSEQSRLLLVGLAGELLDLPWVASVDTMAGALAQAEAHAERTTAALWSVRCQSTGQARASGITPEAWAPLVVVSTVAPSELGERQRLATLANRPRSGTAIVVPALPGTAPIGRALTVGKDGWLRIDGVDVEVHPDHIDKNDTDQVVALLDVASRHDDVPAQRTRQATARARRADLPPSPRPTTPPPPPPPPPPPGTAAPSVVPADRDRPVAAPVAAAADLGSTEPPRRLAELLADVDVLVRVLGEVEAVRLTGDTEERLQPVRQKGLETIVYMALREVPVDREELEIKLFPDGANAAKTVYNTISAARSLVGDDLFPAPTDGRYALNERVVSDYGLFCELVAQAEETEDADVAAGLLSDALGLVRTEPFMGVGRSYAWVGAHRGIIVAQVIDAAEELAEIHLARNDWRSAEWAARRGLRSFPADERMHRLLMRTARAAGNIPGVQRVFRELCEVIADPDLGVEPEDTLHPETIALLEELTGSVSRRGLMGA